MIKVFSTTACPFKIAHFVGKAVQNGNLPLIATDTSDTLYLLHPFGRICLPTQTGEQRNRASVPQR
jgi:hypothetical protein